MEHEAAQERLEKSPDTAFMRPRREAPFQPLYGLVGRDFGLSGSTLKILACVTMLIDHSAATILKDLGSLAFQQGRIELYQQISSAYRIFRGIGRLAFPIFCFLLVEGFFHTRSVRKYALRLFLFALFSEFFFDFALKPNYFYPEKQNVFFTLLIGLITIYSMDLAQRMPILQFMAAAAGMFFAEGLMTDYNWKGVFLIVVLYFFHEYPLYSCIVGAMAISWENVAPLSFIPIYLYNGKRGLSLKYAFYFFYPAHLLFLGLISHFVLPHIRL